MLTAIWIDSSMNDELKRQAAIEALNEVQEGMIVGLGTGSTASQFIRELGEKVRAGFKVFGIPTSEVSARLAEQVGIKLTTLKSHPAIDLTVDGADEVSPELDLIKGLGGALVREKIVAHASKRVLIVVDESKLVGRLGERVAVPVEVVPFGADAIIPKLERWGGPAQVREQDGRPFVSDNGNTIIDWKHGVIDQPILLEKQLKALTGVVDSGIFSNVAACVIVAGANGTQRIERKTSS